MKMTFSSKVFLNSLDFLTINEKNTTDSGYIEQVFIKIHAGKAQMFRYGANVTKVSANFDVKYSPTSEAFEYQTNYDALRAIVKKIAMRYEEFSFEVIENQAILSAGFLNTKLNITNFAAPTEPELEQHKEICVVKTELDRIIQRAKVAAAKQDVRYVLNGILLSTDDEGTLRAVGCDGHRLAVSFCDYLAHVYTHHELIISMATIRYLEDVIRIATENNIVLHFDDNHLSVTLSDGARLKSAVVDGKYPDWRRTIPLQTMTTMRVNREELIASMQSAMPLSEQKFRSATFTIQSTGIKIVTKSSIGDFEDIITPTGFDGDTVTVGLNLDYLQSSLNALDCQEVDILIASPNAGIQIREVGDGSNGLQIIMPLRV